MKSKKKLLFLIIFFPSLFWLILELSTINTKKMPHFGPKTLIQSDTVFYSVNPTFIKLTNNGEQNVLTLDTMRFPFFVVVFIKESYKIDNYRMAGLSEYIQYKKEKIKDIPFVIVTPFEEVKKNYNLQEFKKLEIDNKNIINVLSYSSSFDSLNVAFFKQKPAYVDYSFFALIDQNRNIRGYYDGRYISEIKRLIEEYQHLRLKNEKKNLINQNKIESK